MLRKMNSMAIAVALGALLTISGPRAIAAEAPHAGGCDESCLRGFMDGYLQALAHHDPSRLPLARDVRFTENGVPIQLGQGLWITFSSLGKYRHDIYDTETGGVATFASIRENDFPDLLTVRLKIVDRRISEIETVVVRHAKYAERMASVNPEWTRIWERAEPASTRLTREQLIAGVLGYFRAFAFVDGSRAPFSESCIRLENGMVMSLGPHDQPPLPLPPLSREQASGREWFAAMRTTYGMGCTRQVDTGVYSFITGYANPRFPIVDTKRQIVFAVFNFQRHGTVKTVTMPNGRTYDMMPSTQWPNEVLNTEGWKFVDGRITRIEAVFKADQNFGAGTGWPGGLSGESREPAGGEAHK